MAIGVAKFITAMNIPIESHDSDHAQCGICTPPRRLEMAGSVVALHTPVSGDRGRGKDHLPSKVLSYNHFLVPNNV